MKRRAAETITLPVARITITPEPFRVAAHTRSIALSADERVLATCDAASVRLLDASSGALLQTARIDAANAENHQRLLCFSNDGATLFVGAASSDGETLAPVLVLDAKTLARLQTIEPDFETTVLEAHPRESSLLFVAGSQIAWFDAQSGRREGTFTTNTPLRPVQRALFSPNGRWLATKSDSSIDLWNVTTRERAKTYTLETWSAAFAFSSDSEQPYVCTQGRLVSIAVTREEFPSARMLPNEVVSSRFGPTALFELANGELLLCLGNDLRVFSLRSLQLRRSARDRCMDGARVLSRDAKVLFSNNEEGAIERLDPASLAVHRPSIATAVHTIVWQSADTLMLAHHEAISKVHLASSKWEAVSAFDTVERCTAISNTGDRAVVARLNALSMEVLETETRRVVQSFSLDVSSIIAVSKGAAVIAVLRGTRLQLVRAGAEPSTITHRSNGNIRGTFVGENTLCWIASAGVFFADVATAKVKATVKSTGCSAIATNGVDRVVVATTASLRLFDSSGTETLAIPLKGARFTSTALTRDGALIAGGTRDGKLLLARREHPPATVLLPLRPTALLSMAFSADGSLIVVATNEPELFVYDVASLLDR